MKGGIMTDTTTTDREEAARALVKTVTDEREWLSNAMNKYALKADEAFWTAADAMTNAALEIAATILADIEEGKRKDATIERLTKAGKAVVGQFLRPPACSPETWAEFVAALKEATDA